MSPVKCAITGRTKFLFLPRDTGILSALNVICKFSGTAIPGLGKASWKPPWCWPTPHLRADPVQCCCLTQASASPFLPNENPGVPGSLSWHITVPPARALALDRLPPLSRAKGVILGASLPLSFTFEDGDKAGGPWFSFQQLQSLSLAWAPQSLCPSGRN